VSETISLPVLRLSVPDRCGEHTCEACVVRWLERRAAAEAGASFEGADRLRLRVPITGLRSDHDRARANRRLHGAPARVEGGTLVLEFTRGACPLHQTAARLDGLGLRLRLDDATVEPAPGDHSLHRPHRPLADSLHAAWGLVRRERELALAALGGVCLLAGTLAHWLDGPDPIRLALLALAAALSSSATLPRAFDELRARRVSVDSLMFAAAAGAASLGHPEEGAFLLWLFGLGAAGEHLAMSRARAAIDALAHLAPETARVIDQTGEAVVVPLERVAAGDHLALRPFERVPVDAVIVHGSAAVDQSAVTGEPMPVEKTVGDALPAGVINGESPLVIRAARPAGESTIARIRAMVERAQAEKSPTELFTARVERFYAPAVLLATVALILLPPALGEVGWRVAFSRAMAFLVAASPCALAIGTPAAVLCALARAARIGVLIKSGAHLETLARLEAVAFDKTGTLTEGRPAVTQVIPLTGLDADAVLALAAGLERDVNHPLAEAVRRAAEARGLRPPSPERAAQIVGVGVEGVVDGAAVRVGKPPAGAAQHQQAAALAAGLAAEGATVAWVSRDGVPMGLLAIEDTPRPSSSAGIAALGAAGIARVLMLTGDHDASARAMAARVGIREVHAGLMPEDKLARIDTIRAAGARVAMVGDGVNDAPALARADVGVVIAAAGTDVAMQTADVAVMGGDIGRLAEVIRLARRARGIIAQNLALALGVILVVAPLGALGLAPLGLAVLMHEGSTVLVVLNALRLLRAR
jgi:Cd2+/Zn2+-exporting ATPase